MEIGGFFPYEETSVAETNYAIRMCQDDVPFITVCKTLC